MLLLQLAGQESRVVGTTLLYRGIDIHVVESCDGVMAAITLVAAVLAFPFPRRLARGCSGRSRALRRCKGINVLRIALLVLIAPTSMIVRSRSRT